MPQKAKLQIVPGECYHVFNRGVNRREIFRDDADFQRFLKLINRYISSIGLVFAYALMPDHFHLVIKIYSWEFLPERFQQDLKILGRTFGHLQNSYAKYFNHKYNTVSSVFERSYERVEVDSLLYLKQLVVYVHMNPRKHQIIHDYRQYFWTSYQPITTPSMETVVSRDVVISKFGGVEEFLQMHKDADRSLFELEWDQ